MSAGVFGSAYADAYDLLYGEYVRLHDLFGRGGDQAVKTLKRLRLQAAEAAGKS